MLKRQFLFLVSLLALWVGNIPAQSPGHAYEFLDGNQVNARLMNAPDKFWDLFGWPAYEVPAGSGKNSAFASSIWIGGLDGSQQLHVAASTYRQTGTDFYQGPYRTGGNYSQGRGFTAPGNVFDRGLQTLSSGKVLASYPGGFTVYDPVTNTSLSRFLPQTRNIFDITELPDGRLLLYGDDNLSTISDAMLIDSTNFNITVIGPLNHFHRYSSATALSNGEILIAGVMGAEIFDPVSLSSTSVAAMGMPRLNHAAALLPNGKVMVFGGGSTLQGLGSTASTEIFDPVAGTWAAGPMLTVARGACQLSSLQSGSLLITGGTDNASTFDVYDPIGNTMVSMPGSPNPMDQHAAFALPSGDIFLSSTSMTLVAPALSIYNPTSQTSIPVQLSGPDFLATPLLNGNVLIEMEDNYFIELEPNSQTVVDQNWEKVWKVTRAEVDQFVMDYQNNQVNFANYPDIETWPAHGDVNLGEDPNLAPFIDVNQDGMYRPLQDGDYPCFEGDMALWWVYNDDGPHTETMGQRLGLQVETMAYAYACNTAPCPDTALRYTTFYHHEITNKSTTNYQGVYIGVWMDTDIGNYSDDYVGSDSVLGMGFGYNADNNDETAAGYGQAPPALGTLFLNAPGNVGPATNFMYYENDFSLRGNPEQPVHYYNYMRSRWKDGSHLVDNGSNGYPGTAAGPDVNFMFPGDPGFCGGPASGWSETSAQNQPFDRRYLQAVGPFNLAAGQSVEFDVALIWARGNDNLNSVCQLKNAATSIKTWWENDAHGCFNIVLAEEDAVIEPTGITLYPNPSQGDFTVEIATRLNKGAALTMYDLAGRPVHQQQIPAHTRQVAVQKAGLSKGMYLVQIQSEKTTVTKKIMIRH